MQNKKQVIAELKKCLLSSEINDLKLYNICSDFISLMDLERSEKQHNDLLEKRKSLPIGTKFHAQNPNVIYTIYKHVGNQIWFNWFGDEGGTDWYIDSALSSFKDRTWIKTN